MCSPNQLLPTRCPPASPPPSPPPHTLSPHLGHRLPPIAVSTSIPDAAGWEGAIPRGHPARWQAGGGTWDPVSEWQRGQPCPVTPYRLQGGARHSQTPRGHPAMPAGCQPCLAPAPCPLLPAHAAGRALAHAPARSAPALHQGAQPDPSPRCNFAGDGAGTEPGPARKRFALYTDD